MPIPVVLYFSNASQIITNDDPDSSTPQITDHLTRSLSVILTRFYPLAGRATGEGEFIDCNDAGVPFSVARFRGSTLAELLATPRPDLLLPGGAVAMVQVNCFDCGGVAIGVVFWNKVVDATTVVAVLRAWGARCGLPQLHGAVCILRLHHVIKSKASDVADPTELVSALMWKCFMSASHANGKSTSFLTQTIDLRRRSPRNASATPGARGRHVAKMRESAAKIDGGYVDRMRGDGGLMGYYENLRRVWIEYSEEFDVLPISSLCGGGVYGVDFGWGKPAWFCKCDGGGEAEVWNRVWLNDTRNGDGIEAWVILEEEYMKVLNELRI
ncbi:salutaridinol 7-O-acetyltransferase-like [Salvia splendens]|uniref:salutaridinol 7-O-acetyltransferase-like n=1 Tax=Salvia splendens TaxID=180675 RepID=UPI001C277D7C|nr:salutaridinol 7-O-acetyltransferase-like [Salvia splendens]